MPFPVTKRVIYRKNPLAEVVCQFQFPPVLSIEAEVPAKFQEAIRKTFPLFQENAEFLLRFPNIPGDADAPIATQLEFPSTTVTRKNYEFRTSSDEWKINLTREFIALSTKHYVRWEAFKEHLDPALSAFLQIYAPPYYSRIGLRYKNILNRTELGLPGVDWPELLQPYILGILDVPSIASNVTSTTTITEIKLGDGHSVVRITGGFVQHEQTKELAYMIDNDFFTNQRISIESGVDRLDYFNQHAGRLMQWCITPRLHAAMEPSEI